MSRRKAVNAVTTETKDPRDVANFKTAADVLIEGRRQLDDGVTKGTLSPSARAMAETLFVALATFVEANKLDVADTVFLMVSTAGFIGLAQGALDIAAEKMSPLALSYMRATLQTMNQLAANGKQAQLARTEASFADFDKDHTGIPPGGILQ
jgi:hypothetical protein